MNGKAVILGSFIGAVGILSWSSISNPDTQWPIPLPPPYRYVAAGIAFGLLGLVADLVNEKVPAVLAVGLLIGLATSEFQKRNQAQQAPDHISKGR